MDRHMASRFDAAALAGDRLVLADCRGGKQRHVFVRRSLAALQRYEVTGLRSVCSFSSANPVGRAPAIEDPLRSLRLMGAPKMPLAHAQQLRL